MTSIINHLDQMEARTTNWLSENYPTLIYKLLAGTPWVFTVLGLYLASLSYQSHTAYDLFAGLFLTVTGTVAGTLTSVWAYGEIKGMRHNARRTHPSYPYSARNSQSK
jgi:hypothetical protein